MLRDQLPMRGTLAERQRLFPGFLDIYGETIHLYPESCAEY